MNSTCTKAEARNTKEKCKEGVYLQSVDKVHFTRVFSHAFARMNMCILIAQFKIVSACAPESYHPSLHLSVRPRCLVVVLFVSPLHIFGEDLRALRRQHLHCRAERFRFAEVLFVAHSAHPRRFFSSCGWP